MNFGLLLAQHFGNNFLVYLIMQLSLERLKASSRSGEPFRNVMHPRWKRGIDQPETSSLHSFSRHLYLTDSHVEFSLQIPDGAAGNI